MSGGISLSEIILVLAIIVIFVKPKDIPGLVRKSVKIASQLRAAIKKILDEIDVK
jgi:Sec-independent protein translocase protein TatA